MARLNFEKSENNKGSVFLHKEIMTIGRCENNDLPFKDLAISGFHCLILKFKNNHMLVDLHSTNGTFLNDKRITKTLLHDGDVIRVGTQRLQYFTETKKLDTSPSQEVGESTEFSTIPSFQDKAESNSTGRALRILSGKLKGKTIELSGSVTKLGVSGKQIAVIKNNSGEFVFMSMESDEQNRYPMLNDVPVKFETLSLKPGDVVHINDIQMEFTETPLVKAG